MINIIDFKMFSLKGVQNNDFLFQLLRIEKEKSQNNNESQNINSGQNNRKKEK